MLVGSRTQALVVEILIRLFRRERQLADTGALEKGHRLGFVLVRSKSFLSQIQYSLERAPEPSVKRFGLVVRQ